MGRKLYDSVMIVYSQDRLLKVNNHPILKNAAGNSEFIYEIPNEVGKLKVRQLFSLNYPIPF